MWSTATWHALASAQTNTKFTFWLLPLPLPLLHHHRAINNSAPTPTSHGRDSTSQGLAAPESMQTVSLLYTSPSPPLRSPTSSCVALRLHLRQLSHTSWAERREHARVVLHPLYPTCHRDAAAASTAQSSTPQQSDEDAAKITPFHYLFPHHDASATSAAQSSRLSRAIRMMATTATFSSLSSHRAVSAT